MAVRTYLQDGEPEAIHDAFAPVRDFVESLPASRERSQALTKLDEAKMWTFAHFRVKAGGEP